MKNTLFKITAFSLLASTLVLASGWRLPESSSRSTALSGAYVANSNGADATYYNPANMSFNKNMHELEVDLMIANLKKLKYTDENNSTRNGESLVENTPIPTIFYSSKAYGKKRYGFSVTVPGGLTKRWDDDYAKTYAEEFSLKIIEFNPTVSYLVSKNLSLGAGVRIIYSEGVVKSDGTGINKPAIREMEGKTIEYGYNLALAYQDTSKAKFSLTYRSNIDLKEEGNAKLYLSGTKVYDGGVYVTVPLPAVFSFAVAYDVSEKLNIEVEFDRTFWSAYKNLDFEYKSIVPLALQASFDTPKERDWSDTDAIRLGLTYKYSKQTTLMFGASRDGHPIPDKSVSFESPDYNSFTFSTGVDYELNEKSSIGFGYLYSKKNDRTVTNYNADGTVYMDGTLSNARVNLISFAYRKSF